MTDPSVTSYDRGEKRGGDLVAGDYIIANTGTVWRVKDRRGDLCMVEYDNVTQVWPIDPDRMVPVATLHPADPVHMLRETLNAVAIAFKRNDEGFWIAAPWYEEKPGNEPKDLYLEHMREMHGVKPNPKLEYAELDRFHTEHHTAGIAHAVKHIHPQQRRPRQL